MQRPFKTALLVGAAALALLVGGKPAAAQTIDTTPSWDGSNYIWGMGEPNTATYGQTFTVGASNVLTDFTFYLEAGPAQGGAPTVFDAFVMAWDGTKATGPVLFQSGPYTRPANAGWAPYTINTGSLGLTTGSQYVAFFNNSSHFDGTFDQTAMGFINNGNVYTGGRMVYNNNGSNFNQLTAGGWALTGGDAAFTAHFSSAAAVPEPTSALLFLPGFAAFGLLKLRRKKSAGVEDAAS